MQEQPNLNKVLSQKDPVHYLAKYAVNHGRLDLNWEKFILSREQPKEIVTYIILVIRNRWIEAEEILKKDTVCWEWYQSSVPQWMEAEKLKQKLIEENTYGL